MPANKVLVRVLKKNIRKTRPGETLEVSERDAKVLERLGRAERVEPAEAAAPRKRTYRRRDLTAEE